jgi:hypothetical protein
MQFFPSTFAAVAALPAAVRASYGQQQIFADDPPTPIEDPKDILTKRILAELDADQFCGSSSTFTLYSKGRGLTCMSFLLRSSRANFMP